MNDGADCAYTHNETWVIAGKTREYCVMEVRLTNNQDGRRVIASIAQEVCSEGNLRANESDVTMATEASVLEEKSTEDVLRQQILFLQGENDKLRRQLEEATGPAQLNENERA